VPDATPDAAPAAAAQLSDETPLSPEDHAALAEDVEIDEDTRRRVLILHGQLDRLDHYALLGVGRTADRKTLKRAYYDLAAKFHPDKYFRKKLGSYKLRMEAIFGRITLAHDTLTHKDKREEYDAYLDEQRRSRGIEDLLADALAEIKRAEETADREARAAEAAGGGATPAGSPPAEGAPRAAPKGPMPTVDAAARREALARRLLGGRPPPTSSAPPAQRAPAQPVPSAGDAMAALRRRYEDRKSLARAAQARKYMTNGEAALAAGDAVAAANAFRVAATLTPDDAELARRAREAQARADDMLAETYTRQAGYEERNGQWVDASRSWTRVCKTRPNDANAHERAAHALVKAEGDLHEAGRLALRACSLDSGNPHFHLTLANVYLAAGLSLNARRELETAAQLAPHDGTIQAMLKRVGKPA
jgi:curved DNA-binding protein CbpA